MSAEPVATGLRADARRNRARVLQAAQEAFAAEGIAVPLDEIARRAGVGAGTVYRHFPTKEALFEAIVLGRMRAMGDHVLAQVDAPDPGAAFFAVLSEFVDQGMMKKDLLDALAGAGVDVSTALGDARDRILAAIGALLTRAQAAGAVRTDVTATDVTTLLGSMILTAQRQQGCLPPGVRAVIMDGLRA
ncbi:MAG TPA: helix-turn-helix domain-containing protein [Pseudonocardiaceae bacterium]|jgi:AcrR family transcriptional regulator|nr:helix-turn-helix domain-containing protein [Pseudonocardiaceae bacterium]